jgi:hypothetical protein
MSVSKHAFDSIYALYERNGVRGGRPLSLNQLREFWDALPESEREYWAEQFRLGPTRLTAEFVGQITRATIGKRYAQLADRVRTDS